jgi:DNA polymerase III delta prime subunit
MHAFLIVGTNSEELKAKTEELSEKLHAKIMNFPLVKIEDVRALNDLVRLSFSEPTLIVSENIDGAGEEALNAFLKNLEEPQENIYFALTASSTRKVLPTIVSRCQIIKLENKQMGELANEEKVEQFLQMSPSQKLAFFDKMNDRNNAIGFIESVIFFLHEKGELTNMELLLKTLTGLKSNGAVNLQLLNLITKYAN